MMPSPAPRGGAPNRHAVAAHQAATTGSGAAVFAETTNPNTAALVVRGPGTLIDLQDRAGRSIMQVGQSGFAPSSLAVTGALTAGSVASTGALSGTTIAGTGDLTVSSGNVIVSTAGKGIQVKAGAGASTIGTVTLDGATPVAVATTAVTANSIIQLTVQSPAGTPSGIAWVASRIPGTSFSVVGIALDQSVVGWQIVEPI